MSFDLSSCSSNLCHQTTLWCSGNKSIGFSIALSRINYANFLLTGYQKHMVDKILKWAVESIIMLNLFSTHSTGCLLKAQVNYKLTLICHGFTYGSFPASISNTITVYSLFRHIHYWAEHTVLLVKNSHKIYLSRWLLLIELCLQLLIPFLNLHFPHFPNAPVLWTCIRLSNCEFSNCVWWWSCAQSLLGPFIHSPNCPLFCYRMLDTNYETYYYSHF